MPPIFLDKEVAATDYRSAGVVIIPLPFEQTTSYIRGAGRGPEAILEASPFLEFYDEELDCQPYRVAIFTEKTPQFRGDFGRDFSLITQRFSSVLRDKKFPVGLGGEHSISAPIVRAFAEVYEELSVLQLDAHSDLRDEYEGTPYSHACVMRRIFEQGVHFVQVGIRSQCRDEAEFIKSSHIDTFFAHQLKIERDTPQIIDRLKQNVYITIDVDFFDPSIMPATGTPEPGGFLWYETLHFLRDVFKQKNVVGFDVVELSPINGLAHPDFTAAKLIYKLIGYKFCPKLQGGR